jgi:hypothetical protein
MFPYSTFPDTKLLIRMGFGGMGWKVVEALADWITELFKNI